ncbi:MAG: hypothetical protein H6999_05035 [Hahellaceae bacterium]|nr:hypothetical protein [Hahellaceae bacterium]MCP5169102.1 hypothetical protein [Hahellaceae bacterium]
MQYQAKKNQNKFQKICATLFFTLLIAGCDGKGGSDVTGDGKPDGIRGDNGYCPPYSDSDRPHEDGYCYPG